MQEAFIKESKDGKPFQLFPTAHPVSKVSEPQILVAIWIRGWITPPDFQMMDVAIWPE